MNANVDDLPQLAVHAARLAIHHFTQPDLQPFQCVLDHEGNESALRAIAYFQKPGDDGAPYQARLLADTSSPVVRACDPTSHPTFSSESLPRRAVVSVETLAACGNDKKRWRESWASAFGSQPLTESLLSPTDYRAHVCESAWVEFQGGPDTFLLALESTVKDIFSSAPPKREFEKIAGRVQAFVTASCSVVGTARKFQPLRAWAKQKWRRVALLSGAGSLASAATALVTKFGFLPTWKSESVAEAAAVLLNLFVLVIALVWIVPDPAEVPKSRTRDEKLAKALYFRLRLLCVAWVGFYLTLLVRAVLSIGKDDRLRLGLDSIGSLLSFVAAASALACYFALADRKMSNKVYAVAIAVFGIAAAGVAAELTGHSTLADGFRAFVGIGEGVALALLVGRIDSRLFGTPGLVSGALFAYAVMQGLHPEIFHKGEWLLVVALVLAAPLKALLFLFMKWAHESGAFGYYFATVGKVLDLGRERKRSSSPAVA